MSDAAKNLALRKELLVSQSTLLRARLRYEVLAMRSRAPSRLPLFGLLMMVAGRLRGARWIAKATRLLALFRMARGVLGLLRRK
jgi:hypothetical protein